MLRLLATKQSQLLPLARGHDVVAGQNLALFTMFVTWLPGARELYPTMCVFQEGYHIVAVMVFPSSMLKMAPLVMFDLGIHWNSLPGFLVFCLSASHDRVDLCSSFEFH